MSSNLSRRSFLKGAAALAVVTAASGILTGCATTGAVGGSGAARVFKDGDNVITITSTGINVSSQAGGSLMYAVPTFKVDNQTKTALKFDDDANSITGYTMVVSASFDGKMPEVKPEKAEINLGTDTLKLYDDTRLKDLFTTNATENKVTEGVLAFKAPFTNWNQMVITMTLYKDTKDGDVKVGTATYTFNQ